jgi:hypothetical protein
MGPQPAPHSLLGAVREILSHGAFAVIAPPFLRAEIVSLISAASRRQAPPDLKETECVLAPRYEKGFSKNCRNPPC